MDTATVLQEEAQRVERLARARRYEAAKNVVVNLRRVVENNTKRLGPYKTQLTLLDQIDALLGKLDGTVQGPGGFLAREQMIRQSTAIRADQQRRLDNTEKQLTDERKKLADAETIVEELS